MADMALIQGAINGLKVAGDIAKGFLQLKSISDVQGKVIELQSAILSAQSSALAAQSEQSSMIQRIRDLEEEIARVKAWEKQKERYKLTTPWENSAVVYSLKESRKESEKPHWICTKCYDDGRRTILQERKDKTGYVLMCCPTCKSEVHTGYRGIGPAEYAAD